MILLVFLNVIQSDFWGIISLLNHIKGEAKILMVKQYIMDLSLAKLFRLSWDELVYSDRLGFTFHVTLESIVSTPFAATEVDRRSCREVMCDG